MGAASFAGITGAPVLAGEFEADPLRGAYPGSPRPIARRSATWRWSSGPTLYLIAPASANTIAKLAHGQADNLVSTAALAAGLPGAGRAGDEQPHVPASAMQANLSCWLSAASRCRPRRPAIWPPTASTGWAGCPSRPSCCRRSRRGWPRRPAGAARGSECASWSPRGGPGSRSTACATSATAPRGGWASRWPSAPLAEAPTSRWWPPTSRCLRPPGSESSQSGRRPSSAPPATSALTHCDVLLMAAAVADFRPRDPAAHKLKKDAGTPLSGARTDRRRARAHCRRAAAPARSLVGFAAEHGDGAIDYAATSSTRKRLDAIVVNDISQPGIGFDAPENEVTILARDGSEHRLRRSRKEQIADGVLDEVEKLRTKESDDRAIRADPARTAGV